MTVENLTISVKTNADKAAAKLNTLSDAIDRVQTSAKNVSGNTERTSSGIKSIGNAAQRAHKPLGGFLASLKRIAFYRFLRTVIKSIAQAFQEGLLWAYQFSSGIDGEGNRFAQAMDRIKTSGSQMKAQLGSAFIGLLTQLEPIIVKIINLITQVADAISQIFAAFTGNNYLKAETVPQNWAEAANAAAGAAKEWKNQLLGFDEINRLDEPSSGGRGGADNSLNPFDFTATELSDWAKRLREFFSDLKISFKDIVFDWDDLTGEQIAEKVITGLSGLVGAGVGFLIGGVPGAVIGTLVGVALGMIFSSLIFDHDGELSSQELAAMLCVVAGALVGGIIGFTVGGGFHGALIGAAVGMGLTMLATGIIFKTGSEDDRWGALTTLIYALSALVGGMIGFAIGGVAGAVIGASIGVGISLLVKNVFFDGKEDQSTSMLETLVDILIILAGTVIGFAVGGVFGAAIGATVGVGITLALNKVLFNSENATADNFAMISTLVAALGAVVGGIIGFTVGGPLGALIGAVIGCAVTLAVTQMAWSQDSFSNIPAPPDLGSSASVSSVTVNNGLPVVQPHGNGISLYAGGGFPETGDLFFANENGAEMVGSLGGRTAVASNDQIVEGIRQGVYDAVVAANASGNNDVNVNVYLDSREIRAGQQRLSRSMGV